MRRGSTNGDTDAFNGPYMSPSFGMLPGFSPHTAPGTGPPPPNMGVDIQAKKLYEHEGQRGCGIWVEEVPKIRLPTLTRTDHFAILLRMIEHKGDFAPAEIVIQNQSFKKLLELVFAGYAPLEAEFKARTVTFRAPFHEFFYCWQSYEKHFAAEHDNDTQQCFHILDDIIRPIITPHIAAHRDILSFGVSKFEDLWTVFSPGAEVYHGGQQDDKLLLLETCDFVVLPGGAVALRLNCKNISWDGGCFGWQLLEIDISDYKGNKNIGDLEAFPSMFHQQRQRLTERLTERGRNFVDLAGFHFKLYSGLWTVTGGMFTSVEMEKGRIVIDAGMHKQLNPNSAPLLPLKPAKPAEDGEDVDGLDQRFSGLETRSFDQFQPTRGKRRRARPHERYMHRADDLEDSYGDLDPPTQQSMTAPVVNPGDVDQPKEHEYRYCSPKVRGFCLNSKQWGEFSVSKVADIEFNRATFSRLIMPEDYKELILAFVQSKIEKDGEFDDIVEGKGQGMIFLLTGQPGVGKTLTAEAVAEEMQRPLYVVSASDLGHSAATLEKNLQKALSICTKWNCILLIDECDVYLEERKTNDMERNKLVAVFLRLLEYYRGVLFLTTNRVETFDKAFKSRIDLNIHYPNLSTTSRKHIWETFLKPSDDFPQNESCVTEEELEKLAGMEYNGREIKNLVKTGRLLAGRKKEVLGMKHLATVMRVQQVNPDALGLK